MRKLEWSHGGIGKHLEETSNKLTDSQMKGRTMVKTVSNRSIQPIEMNLFSLRLGARQWASKAGSADRANEIERWEQTSERTSKWVSSTLLRVNFISFHPTMGSVWQMAGYIPMTNQGTGFPYKVKKGKTYALMGGVMTSVPLMEMQMDRPIDRVT